MDFLNPTGPIEKVVDKTVVTIIEDAYKNAQETYRVAWFSGGNHTRISKSKQAIHEIDEIIRLSSLLFDSELRKRYLEQAFILKNSIMQLPVPVVGAEIIPNKIEEILSNQAKIEEMLRKSNEHILELQRLVSENKVSK